MVLSEERKFKNLISTATLAKEIRLNRGYDGPYLEQAIYKMLDKCGVTWKTQRGGKKYFNRSNAWRALNQNMFKLFQMAEQLREYYDYAIDDGEKTVGYGRDDMSNVSRELLANDGVFGADENELYSTNEGKKTINISDKQLSLFEIKKPLKVNISEEQYNRLFMNEDVYANKLKGNNKLSLTYNKRQSSNRTRMMDQLNTSDRVDTGKMDQDNADTYEVPLKGGIVSYNITSIKGTEVMHYFKNKRKAKMSIDLDGDGSKEEYELWMSDPEYNEFINMFCHKVGKVLEHVVSKIYGRRNNKVQFNGVSILPVPSSSNFNKTMVDTLVKKGVTFSGLPVVAINAEMFKKDTNHLKKDNTFIKKNKDYYSNRMFKTGDNGISHEEYIDNTIDKMKQINGAKPFIDTYNAALKQLTVCYNNRKQFKTEDALGRAMAVYYKKLYDAYIALKDAIKGNHENKVFKPLKGHKGQIKDRRTEIFWSIVKPYLRGSGCAPISILPIEQEQFQIKNLSNDTRMGLKNFFTKNAEIVEQEMQKIQGTIFVIFDDNISGGATLSDMCYQAKQLGIDYIVPITFGEMATKYSMGPGYQINKPSKDGKFEKY